MSLFNVSETALELSVAQLQVNVANAINAMTRRNYGMLCQMQKAGVNVLCHTPGLTPQQVCDSLGKDAAKRLQMHGILTGAIAAVAALDGSTPDIMEAGVKFTLNADGTVSIAV